MPNGRKLTEGELRRARVRCETSDESLHSIARKFGCSAQSLQRQLGEAWATVAATRKANGWRGIGRGNGCGS